MTCDDDDVVYFLNGSKLMINCKDYIEFYLLINITRMLNKC